VSMPSSSVSFRQTTEADLRFVLKAYYAYLATGTPWREFYERKGMRCDGGEQDHAVTATERLA